MSEEQAEVAQVFPREFAEKLRAAVVMHKTEAARMEAIDVITDEMARRGLVRPRHEMGAQR